MTRWYQIKKREHFYREAKRLGYRARSAFKLKEIQRRFHILSEGDTVIDLGAAPGGWCQVAKEIIGKEGVVIGVDILPISPLENVQFIQGDVTQQETIDEIKKRVEKADVILSDMSPDISGNYSVDQARSVWLSKRALEVAEELLKPGGNFVCKIFEGEDAPDFIDKVKRRFYIVRRFTPKASRKSSSEIYIIAKSLKIPYSMSKKGDKMSDQPGSLESFLQKTFTDIENKIYEMITDKKILSILEGGKRLRPLLASISFKVCTGGKESESKYQKFLEGAVAIELAHGASLVHDDIIDGDLNRRGEPAFYIKTGIDNAILIGHKMLVMGFGIAISHGVNIAKLYIQAWSETLNGQLSEINFNSRDLNSNISPDSKFFHVYSKIIDLKTATLFSSACKAGALWADASDELADVLAEYGREVGFAYQLADDLVDLEKGEMIDSVVIPLLSRLEKKSVRNGSLKAKIIKEKIEKNSTEINRLYLNEIKKHLSKAKELSRSEKIPNNSYRKLLEEVPTYIINRMLKEINVAI